MSAQQQPEAGANRVAALPAGPFVPSIGPLVRDDAYASRLRTLARLDLEESRAEAVWRAAVAHRRALTCRLQRDVGLGVALLDYLTNIRRQLVEPQIIERAALEAIERRAIADPLTGLYNRRYFDSAFAQEIERGLRYGTRPSLLLLDVDRFKAINDRHGHDVGDMVLRKVSEVIRAQGRAADIACRPGGDEFAVVMPHSKGADARIVGDRIRAGVQMAFAATPFHAAGLAVTVSGGVAAAGLRTATAERVVKEADRALYDAKRAGGNRIGPCGRGGGGRRAGARLARDGSVRPEYNSFPPCA